MSKKILLVEDEVFIRELYELALTQHGFSVDCAEDGELALQKLTQTSPAYDLVILDIMLPKLDGISVLKQMKMHDSKTKDIPVFLLTNLGLDSVIKQALSLGAQKYFIKANFLPKDIVREIDLFFQTQS